MPFRISFVATLIVRSTQRAHSDDTIAKRLLLGNHLAERVEFIFRYNPICQSQHDYSHHVSSQTFASMTVSSWSDSAC